MWRCHELTEGRVEEWSFGGCDTVMTLIVLMILTTRNQQNMVEIYFWNCGGNFEGDDGKTAAWDGKTSHGIWVIVHSLTLFWILGWGEYLLVRLHKLNHESCEVAALYASLWPKHCQNISVVQSSIRIALSTMFNSPHVLVLIIECVWGHTSWTFWILKSYILSRY